MNEQPPKPNFDFIVNQQVPEQKPKRFKKPFVILAISLAAMLVLVGFAAIFSKKATNVQQVSTGQSSEQQNQQKTIATDYLTKLSSGDYTNAYNLLDQKIKNKMTAGDIQKNTEEKLGSIDLGTCTFKETGQTNNISWVAFYCITKNKRFARNIRISFASNTNSINGLYVL